MKKNNNIDLLDYKLKIFVTRGFCVLSFITIICIVFLVLFAFDILILTDLNNNICNNINSILMSITSGYLVSYFVYLLTVHFPNYAQTIINDRIICNHLSLYRNRLLYSFGGLIYKLKEEKEEKKIIKIPEITKMFESHEYKDKSIVKTIQWTYNSQSENNNNLLLAKDFERLEDAFQNLLNLNALYKGRFSNEIYQLQISEWNDILFIIKDEIRNPKTDFNILNDSKTEYLINQNFDLANKAVQVNILINSNKPILYYLYKTIKTLCQKVVLRINKIWNIYLSF